MNSQSTDKKNFGHNHYIDFSALADISRWMKLYMYSYKALISNFDKPLSKLGTSIGGLSAALVLASIRQTTIAKN